MKEEIVQEMESIDELVDHMTDRQSMAAIYFIAYENGITADQSLWLHDLMNSGQRMVFLGLSNGSYMPWGSLYHTSLLALRLIPQMT